MTAPFSLGAHWPAAPGRRRVLLHCGLHKTGSSALQYFFCFAAGLLRARGILYPVTGRPPAVRNAQHNIAWQLAGDARFDPRAGTVDDLAAEIGAFPGDAIVSSEDFESLLETPERLAPLLRHPALRGHAFTLLIYLRDQASYLEALFPELLRHDLTITPAEMYDRIIARGALRDAARVFQFDYAALLARLRRLTGAEVALRAYDRLEGGTLVFDIIAYAGLGIVIVEGDARQRINPRPPLESTLGSFCGPPVRKLLAMPRIRALLKGRRASLSPALRARLAARFAGGNRSVEQAAGWPAGSLHIDPRIPSDALVMEHLFTPELRARLTALAGQDLNAATVEATLATLAAALPPGATPLVA